MAPRLTSRPPLHMSRGRRLLIALLQLTSARHVAARCAVYPQRVTDWVNGHRVPCSSARERLARNYGIGVEAWDVEWREPDVTQRTNRQ